MATERGHPEPLSSQVVGILLDLPAFFATAWAEIVTVLGPDLLTPRVAAPTYAATITQSVANIDRVNIDLTGNLTLNLTGGVSGQRVVIRLKQDATGSRLLTLGTMFRLGTDITGATLTTAASKTDYLTVVYNAAATKYDVIAFVKGY